MFWHLTFGLKIHFLMEYILANSVSGSHLFNAETKLLNPTITHDVWIWLFSVIWVLLCFRHFPSLTRISETRPIHICRDVISIKIWGVLCGQSFFTLPNYITATHKNKRQCMFQRKTWRGLQNNGWCCVKCSEKQLFSVFIYPQKLFRSWLKSWGSWSLTIQPIGRMIRSWTSCFPRSEKTERSIHSPGTRKWSSGLTWFWKSVHFPTVP